jgi:protein O-GlcNAc transferase
MWQSRRAIPAHALSNLPAILSFGDFLQNSFAIGALMTRTVQAEDANRQGVMLCKAGATAKGVDCFRQAILLAPDTYEYHLNLGNALNEIGKWAEAKDVLGRASDLAPTQADIHKALATAFAGLGQSEELIQRYQNALSERPNDRALARNFCVVLMQLRELPRATEIARELAAGAPNDIEAKLLLATCLENSGQFGEAAKLVLSVLEQVPRHVPAGLQLGLIQSREGRYEAAATTFETVLRITPNHLEATQLLGLMQLYMGKVSSAISLFNRVLGKEPNSLQTLQYAAWAYSNRGSPEAAMESYRAGLKIAPGQANVRSNYLYTLTLAPSVTRTDLFEAHREWGRLHGTFPKRAHANANDPERRLKVGYISADFREHSVAYFIEPLLQAHSRKAVEIFCYADGVQFDETSRRLKRACDIWRDIGLYDDKQVTDLIQDDAIDILVDLAGHTATNRLGVFARGPAPVQISWLGYPETSGVPAIGYKITANIVSPPGDGDAFSSETLLRIPNGFHCYRPPANSPQVPSPPHLRNKHITFGCFADLPKINPGVIMMWAAVLRAAPGTRLLLKCRQFADESVRDKYLAMFGAAGVSPVRLTLLDRSPTTLDHLSTYSEIDIALDTFPYNGTTTICEALWMGVPVVTMIGERPASRVGASLMHQVKLTEMIARDQNEFVTIATGLARDTAKLDQLRYTMRERLVSSSLRNEAGFAGAMELAYRTAWRQWCANPVR